jgi:putative membrane protein
MYTRRIFPVKGVIKWTRRHIFLFLVLATIPVILFDILGWKWLHLPWLPLGVLGTAVAFIVSFKNNASYDRLWEARKIWGGIVNSSRSWTIMVKDFITNSHSKKQLSDEELQEIKKELVHRHVAWLTALRYQMRKEKPWEAHLKTKKSNKEFRETQYSVYENIVDVQEAIAPYISDTERKEIFAKGNQASQLLGIQSRRLKELMDQGLIEDFRHMEMTNMLVEFYTLQGKSERIKNFPYPRQFATLNYLFVWSFIILLPFGVMEGFESIGDTVLEQLSEHDFRTEIMPRIQAFIARHFV